MEVVSMLLPVSDALAVDREGRTALIWAAAAGDAQSVDMLLPVSDPSAVDCVGNDAASGARDNGHGAVADLIEAYARAMAEAGAIREASEEAKGPTPRPKAL